MCAMVFLPASIIFLTPKCISVPENKMVTVPGSVIPKAVYFEYNFLKNKIKYENFIKNGKFL
jgi:hypothetical protein